MISKTVGMSKQIVWRQESLKIRTYEMLQMIFQTGSFQGDLTVHNNSDVSSCKDSFVWQCATLYVCFFVPILFNLDYTASVSRVAQSV
jgi:hypothetical protein